MIRAQEEWPGDIRELLEEERSIPSVPEETKERILARAREALAEESASRPLERRPLPLLRWAVSVAVIGLASAAGGVAAFELCVRTQVAARPAAVATASAAPVDQPGRTTTVGAQTDPALEAPEPAPSAVARQAGRRADEEVWLLDRARTALEREDFAGAMGPIAEHARRFKHGRLAEEREALRVKALSSLGLRDEVRRAAEAFEARFPRSPLVPVVDRLASSCGAGP
jgi:hypothetical protein